MEIEELAKSFMPCRECALANTTEQVNLPSTARVVVTLRHIFSLMFPGCHGLHPVPHERCHMHLERLFIKISREMEELITQVFRYVAAEDKGATVPDAHEVTLQFMSSLNSIHAMLEQDITAAYEGDPAAMSKMEVVMAYPCVYAITVHRIAHALYQLKVPILPRIMSELAHSKTGIDIHPGAQIGERFFIDHGTGVVIGETCVIGRNVKLYQGVTLGALSFPKDEATGVLVKGIKRHPNVEDNVVIYAGATILGGDTVVGHDSEIGGNVWLMDSVPPNSRVYNKPPAPTIKRIN